MTALRLPVQVASAHAKVPFGAQAASAHQRIDAPIELARTRVDWACVLMMRGRRGDHDRAREQVGLALSTAETLGLATIKRRAQALLGELTPA